MEPSPSLDELFRSADNVSGPPPLEYKLSDTSGFDRSEEDVHTIEWAEHDIYKLRATTHTIKSKKSEQEVRTLLPVY